MSTLADKAILSGADNRPSMLENAMYDSWKSKMELYMMNRQHGRMILESVENGPLIWPEEYGVTRPKKYSELTISPNVEVSFFKLLHTTDNIFSEEFAFVYNHLCFVDLDLGAFIFFVL
ncbi:hypothetical protein Tco_1548512 [Tanacetum coccineum]